MGDKVITIYADGACSGNPGLFSPCAARLLGLVGARNCVASRQVSRPVSLERGYVYV